MKLAIVTDAWYPQVNGVVTTMSSVIDCLREQGVTVEILEPGAFRTVPCPGYPEIRLAVNVGGVGRRLEALAPDRVHVVTEGPLGLAAMRFLRRRSWRHTTSFHTRFPEYVRARLPFVPLSWGYAWLRRFHGDSQAVLVPTAGMARDLGQRGFERLRVWSRGVDTRVFHPEAAFDTGLQSPLFLYAGRLAPEKNLEAFLELDLPGTKVLVGDGPSRTRLEATFPDAVFPGYRHGHDLAAWYASADVFVFPSRTDTYGVVMLEAMACGTPVAAYPVTGPIDVVRDGETGRLDEDLRGAAIDCLDLCRETCAAHGRSQDWRTSARFFLEQTVDALAGGDPQPSRTSARGNPAR